jgi:signal peptidase I
MPAPEEPELKQKAARYFPPWESDDLPPAPLFGWRHWTALVGADTGDCGIKGEGPFYSGGPETRHPCSQPTRARSEVTFVKRVVGLPGDTIAIINGHVIRNGKPAVEPFASSCSGAECNLNPIRIARGTYFLMGDNRGNSDDSRFWGPVPRDWIIGKAVVSYWPPKDVGGL